MIKWPNLGLFGDFEVCESGIIDALNKNFFLLDVIVQMGVIDFVPTLPPSPVDGDIYILTTFDNIQAWDGTKWVEITPNPGTIAYLINEDRFYWFDGTNWVILPVIFGDVVGPLASTDNAIARYDGTSGKIIQDSLVSISDAGIMTGSIQTITDQLTALITETNFLSAKYYEITGMTGAVDLIAPASLIGKIQSAITQINNIAAPFGVGSYNRVNILVNETVNDVVISDAGNIRTGLSSDLNLAPNASVMIMYDSVLNIWRVIGGSGGGGGSGLKNFILNPDADSGIKGYALYKDAAGTYPVDGTGGTSALTLTTSGTLPLSGKKSFILTKPASNAQGEGFSYDFSIDSVNKARVQQISFDYMVDSGTFVAGSKATMSDFIVYIYDVTNGVLIEPSNIKLLSNSTTLSDRFSATFQTSSNSTSYRLIFHCATVSALAYALKIDNISVSPSVYVYGSPVTAWQRYTPVFQGFGTPTAVEAYWRRVGGSVEITAAFTSGTSTAAEARVGLPPGLTSADTSLIPTIRACGPSSPFNVATTNQYIPLIEPSVTYFTIGVQNASASGQVKLSSTSSFFGSGNRVNFSASIPIQGWSSSIQMSDQADTRIVSFTGNKPTSQALTAGVTNISFITTKDSHGVWNGTQYIVPVAGDYIVTMTGNSNAANEVVAYVNGVQSKIIVGLGAVEYHTGSNTLENLKAGDVLSLRAGGITITGSAVLTTIAISRISGPQAIAASETIAMRATNASGQSVSTGANAVLTGWVKDFDTHGAFNASTGIFTVPAAGYYRISALITPLSKTYSIDGAKYHALNIPAVTTLALVGVQGTSNATYLIMQGSTLAYFNAGSTISLLWDNNSGTNGSLLTSSVFNWITIERIK